MRTEHSCARGHAVMRTLPAGAAAVAIDTAGGTERTCNARRPPPTDDPRRTTMDAQRHARPDGDRHRRRVGHRPGDSAAAGGRGARVIGCDVNAAGLGETQDLLAAQGLHAEPVTADITVQDDVEAVLGQVGGAPLICSPTWPGSWTTSRRWTKSPTSSGPMSWLSASTGPCGSRGRCCQGCAGGAQGRVVMVASEGRRCAAGRPGVATPRPARAAGPRPPRGLLLRPPGHPLQCRAARPGGDRHRCLSHAGLAVGHGRAVASMGGHGAHSSAGGDRLGDLVAGLRRAGNVNGAVVAADGGWSAA